ncbi:hypothetical protein MSG28_006232 [Choristoneura fumiferana]|uniref:Uncharacterized protein n=1 Tax=Choristoneura fumiferana TaxID=7141 RepID=A0ACC0JE47_CHOFU|nr:hypothetical protein MSG28_006232 [Choristoneura fumiferana]
MQVVRDRSLWWSLMEAAAVDVFRLTVIRFLLVASDIAYTVIVSIAACVLVDAPFSTLQRMLMAAIAPQKPPAKEAAESKIVENKDGLEPKHDEEK